MVASLVFYAVPAVGWLMENKPYAYWAEALRLLVVSCTLFFMYIHNTHKETILAGNVILLIISYVWLYKISQQQKKY